MLRPWQATAVPHLLGCLSRHGAAADLSDPGTGKTYTACAIVKSLDRPTLVVSPKVVLPAWHKVAGQIGTELDAINYEMVRTGRTAYGDWRREKYQKKDRFHWNRAIGFLIFDECHRVGGVDTKNSELAIAARRQGIPALLLSATLAESPLDLKAAGYVLRLHDGDDDDTLRKIADPFYNWARRHGCNRGASPALEFNCALAKRTEFMAKIHNSILPDKGIRVRIADLGDAFPESQITAELYEAGSPEKVDALYKEMAEALRELAAYGKENHKCPDAVLTKLIVARQQIELIKVPIFVELAQDAIAQGQIVALFVNFRQTLEEICKRLKTDCIIDGSQIGERGARERQANIERFQSGQSQVIVANGDSGGVGVSLHGAKRLAIISPGYSAKALRQILGRVWRSGGDKSIQRIICLADTVEEEVSKAITRKLACLDALCDGDLMP